MKKFFSLFAMFFLIGTSFSQVTFQKLYSGGPYTSFAETAPTSDGGYIVGGSVGASSSDYLLSKLTSSGQVSWAKHIGSWMGNETASRVGEVSTGGYYLLGTTSSTSVGGEINLIKFDVSGNIVWNKTYGSNASIYSAASFPSLRPLPDGGFIISATLFEEDGMFFSLFRVDASGSLLWTKTYGEMIGDKEECYDVERCSDGGFLMVGDGQDTGLYTIKTDSNGNMQWAKKYATTANDYFPGTNVTTTADGGYLIGGSTYDFTGSYSILTKLDASGNVSWSKKYTNPANLMYGQASACQTADGGYAFLSSFSNYPFLIKTNASGKYLWSKYYTLTGNAMSSQSTMNKTPDGGFIISSSYTDSTGMSSLGYLVKTNALGNSGCTEINDSVFDTPVSLSITSPFVSATYGTSGTISFISEDLVFSQSSDCDTDVTVPENKENTFTVIAAPNPFSSSTTLQIFSEGLTSEENHFELFDISGRKLRDLRFKGAGITIQREDLPSGIYIWTLIQGNTFIAKGKLITE
jgi:hypothetical protein